MTRTSRLIVAVAALLLVGAYVLPLWHISLDAPQYPEGLGLYISVDKIQGVQPQDLESINNLNHYIGMKRITPGDIPELRFMPIALGVLIAGGLLVALVGRRGLLYAWTGLFIAGSLAGLADFYKWGYDYGHDLDPHAILKVPGMTYQPPLIGTKQLLNFAASSWPAAGGWLAIAALVGALTVCVIEFRRRRHNRAAAAPITRPALASARA